MKNLKNKEDVEKPVCGDKPREWWIFPNDSEDNIWTEKPSMNGEVHVVEKQAYDKACAKAEEWKAWALRLESAMFDKPLSTLREFGEFKKKEGVE